MNTTTNPQEGTMDFSTVPHGLLEVGTVTPHGTVVGRSYTAYEMADGSYVPFMTVHGPYKPVAPLAVFG